MKKSYLAICGSLFVAACGASEVRVAQLPVADPGIAIRPQSAIGVVGYVNRIPASPEEWRTLNDLQGPDGGRTQ